MSPETIAAIVGNTSFVVGILLAAATFGLAHGLGSILTKYIESVARQPELRPMLMGQMLFTVGLIEAFPMIILGVAMWFTVANPYISAAKSALGMGG